MRYVVPYECEVWTIVLRVHERLLSLECITFKRIFDSIKHVKMGQGVCKRSENINKSKTALYN